MKKGLAVVGVAVGIALGWWFVSMKKEASAPAAASEPEIVSLSDGDTYALVAHAVTKDIDGVPHKMLAYNGSVPGPILKIPQGAEITIDFRNDLGMNTLLHSHGVRMENPFDGAQTSQREMKPGETFSYRLTFPDAGVYWYHPHVREDYQQELGLYGNYVVVPSEAGYWPPVNREVPIVLDDVLLENGEIRLDEEKADHVLMGRFGNVMLVNGETDFSFAADKGDAVRFYVTNVANARPFNFVIHGARMKLVGGDGGSYERAEFVDGVVLGPSERAVIDVLFEESGTYPMRNVTPEGVHDLGTVVVGDAETVGSYTQNFVEPWSNASVTASMAPFRPRFEGEPDKRLSLAMDMIGMAGGGHGTHMMAGGHMMADSGMMMGGIPEGGIEWEDHMGAMNAASTSDAVRWHLVDVETGKKDMDIDWVFTRGEAVKIRITNPADVMHPMQHPIHFHGQRFLIVSRDGVPQTNLVWKDTVLLKAGEVVDIVLDASNPGTWMAHCHIAEHLEAGMMMTFEVR